MRNWLSYLVPSYSYSDMYHHQQSVSAQYTYQASDMSVYAAPSVCTLFMHSALTLLDCDP